MKGEEIIKQRREKGNVERLSIFLRDFDKNYIKRLRWRKELKMLEKGLVLFKILFYI